MNCGTMLRECVRFEALAKIVLHSPNFFDFFKYVEVSTFDIASDAFATFKENQSTVFNLYNREKDDIRLKLQLSCAVGSQ